jgi:hypothetical protein
MLIGRWPRLAGLLARVFFSTACGAAATATTALRETPAPSSMPEASDFPDTTGAAMLQYLTEQDYQEACESRTGKGEMNSDLFNSTKS